MNSPLSFKEYLASKDQLLDAVHNTPKRTATYTVRKYCKLPIGESKDTKDVVPLKPKQIVFIEWLYENHDNPTPVNVKFKGVDKIDSSIKHNVFWKGSKLAKWLIRNTKEELN